MNKKEKIEKIILIVENAIADNAEIDVEAVTVVTDFKGVERITKQVAEEVYKMFETITVEKQGTLGKCGVVAEKKQQEDKTMKKQQVIDLMTKDFETNKAFGKCFAGGYSQELPTREFAEALYNAGYKKTSSRDASNDQRKAYQEGFDSGLESVAKSEYYRGYREGYECGKELGGAKSGVERLQEQLAEYTKPIDEFIKDRQVEAVKEFAEKVKKQAIDRSRCIVIQNRGLTDFDFIDDLLKGC